MTPTLRSPRFPTGPQHDESAAVDCVVEIRNHPRSPPKTTIKEFQR